MTQIDDEKTNIQESIAMARKGVGERVDQIGHKLRQDFDIRRIAGENAPQLVAAGVAAGIVLGYALPKPVLRLLQIAVPAGIAAVVLQKVTEQAACDEAPKG
jgi:hypothetical protein